MSEMGVVAGMGNRPHGQLFPAQRAGELKVVRLSRFVRFALPPLLVSTLPRSAIGFSFERGMFGTSLGTFLLISSLAIGYTLSKVVGIIAYPVSFWLLGATGAVMIYNSVRRSIAFVKPLCSTCRLLPVIEEHEALHLSGLAREGEVWLQMRERYSPENLWLDSDTGICDFCPIPRRLKEH